MLIVSFRIQSTHSSIPMPSRTQAKAKAKGLVPTKEWSSRVAKGHAKRRVVVSYNKEEDVPVANPNCYKRRDAATIHLNHGCMTQG